MPMFLTILALAAQPPASPADCVLSAIPEAQHEAIGGAVLARRSGDVVDKSSLLKATDDCARRYSLSVEKALSATGYASLYLASKEVARQLGHPEWFRYAVVAVRERTEAQRLALSEPDSGADVFKTVLARMVEQEASIGPALRASDDARAQRFILMIRLFAVAEVQRGRSALP